MGTSETIEDKIKSDQKFRELMSQLEKESTAEEERLLGLIKSSAKDMYETNGWDYARLFGDRRADYQNYADWSLARVTNIIDTIGGALSAGDFPSKAIPGSDKASKSTVDNAKEFLGAFSGDYSLTIARVTALISGVLAQFSVASEAKRNSVMQDLPMAGGLHLFFALTGNVFQRNEFFTNQYLASFQIVFETYMSVDEAKSLGMSQILKTTSQELDLLNGMIIDVRQKQAESLKKILAEEPDKFVTTNKTYREILAEVKADRQLLLAEYDQYKNVMETVDAHFASLDLGEFKRANLNGATLSIDNLFDEKEARIARRYVREKLRT